MARNVKPGGWAEFHDYDLEWVSDDNSVTDDSYTRKWNKLFLEACHKGGRTPSPGPNLKRLMEEAGFTNVVEEKRKFPMGPWPKDPVLVSNWGLGLLPFGSYRSLSYS